MTKTEIYDLVQRCLVKAGDDAIEEWITVNPEDKDKLIDFTSGMAGRTLELIQTELNKRNDEDWK